MAGGGEEAPMAAPAAPRPLFGGCWSCRLVCSAGLFAAALWLYLGPRRRMKAGIPPDLATVAQITLAISVGAWGAVVLVDPVGKQKRKEP